MKVFLVSKIISGKHLEKGFIFLHLAAVILLPTSMLRCVADRKRNQDWYKKTCEILCKFEWFQEKIIFCERELGVAHDFLSFAIMSVIVNALNPKPHRV